MYMFMSTLTHMHTEASVTCGTSSGTCTVSGDSCSQALGVKVDRSLPMIDYWQQCKCLHINNLVLGDLLIVH